MAAEIVHILGPGASALAATLSAGSGPNLAFVGNDVAPNELSPEPPAAVLLTRAELRSDPRIQKLVTEHPVNRRPGMLTTDGLDAALDPAAPQKVYPVLSDLIEKAWIRHSLAQFHDLGGSEFVGEMVELFCTESERHVTQLSRAIETADWNTAGRIAHTLKSSFANYGARRLQKVAQTMEAEINAGQTGSVKQHFETLAHGISRLRELLKSMAWENLK